MMSAPRRWLARVPAIVALSIVTLPLPDASAQLLELLDPESVERSPWRTEAIAELDANEAVAQLRFARADPTMLADRGPVAITFDPNVDSVVLTPRAVEPYDGGFNWSGVAPEGRAYAVLTVEGETVLGIVRVGHRLFEVRPFGGGVHLLIEWSDQLLPPEARFELMQRDATLHRFYLDYGIVALEPACSTVTLLVVTTSDLRASVEVGGATVRQFVENRVFDLNQALENSDVQLKIKRVFMYETPDAQSLRSGCEPIAEDLYRAQTDGDGWSDEVHYYRDLYGADVVALVGDYGWGCGGMSAAVFAVEASAFVITSYQAAMTNLSLAHEIGHIFGAGHNPEEPYAYSPFDDGKALCLSAPSIDHPCGWRTVVSYRCGSDLDGDGVSDLGCDRLPYFSNPDVSVDGSPTGTAGSQDNANVISTTACVVAAFRREATLRVSSSAPVLELATPAMLTVEVRRDGEPVPFAEISVSVSPRDRVRTVQRVTTGADGLAMVPVVGLTRGKVTLQVRSEGTMSLLSELVQ